MLILAAMQKFIRIAARLLKFSLKMKGFIQFRFFP